jgi:LSD1 subclass zinc finger protein
MSFLTRARLWIERVLRSCYGGDQLSMTMAYAALALILLGAIPNMSWLIGIAYAMVICSFIRMFSRNRVARARENQWFLDKTAPLTTRFQQELARFRNRRNYLYFRCPGCKAWLKLPRGAGQVTVTCGRCGHKTDKKA